MNYDESSSSSSSLETLSALLIRCFNGSRTKVKYYINTVREKQVSLARVIGLVRSLSVSSNVDAFITEALDRALFQQECVDQLCVLLNVSEEDALQAYFNLKACGYTEGSILAYLRSHCSLPLEVLTSQIQIIVEKTLLESSSILIMVLCMFHFDHDTMKAIGQEMAILNICLPTLVDKLMLLNPTTDRQHIRDLISGVIQSKRASDSILAEFFVNIPSNSSSFLCLRETQQPSAAYAQPPLIISSSSSISSLFSPWVSQMDETLCTLDGKKTAAIVEGNRSGGNVHDRLRDMLRRTSTLASGGTTAVATNSHQPSARLDVSSTTTTTSSSSSSSSSIGYDNNGMVVGIETRETLRHHGRIDNSASEGDDNDDIISVDDENDELRGAPPLSAESRAFPAHSQTKTAVLSLSSYNADFLSSSLSSPAKRFKRYRIETEQDVQYKPPRLPMQHVPRSDAVPYDSNDRSSSSKGRAHSPRNISESISSNRRHNEASGSSTRPDRYIERFDVDTGAVLDSFASINEALSATGAPYYALIQDLQNGTDGTCGWRYVYRSKAGHRRVCADEEPVAARTTLDLHGLVEKAPTRKLYHSKSTCPCIRQLTTSFKQHFNGKDKDGEDRDALDVLLFACRKLHRTCTVALFEVGIAEQALLTASAAGNSAALTWLLEIPSQWYRLDVNCVDSEGRSALLLSCEAGYIDCVCRLLVAGADVTVTDNVGRSPASVAQNEAVSLALRYCQSLADGEKSGVVTISCDAGTAVAVTAITSTITTTTSIAQRNTAGGSKELLSAEVEAVGLLSLKKSKFEGDTDSECTHTAAAVHVANDSGYGDDKRSGRSDSATSDKSGGGNRYRSASAAAGVGALLSKSDTVEARERSVAPRRSLRPRPIQVP